MGSDDKRQLIAVFAGSLARDFLLPQLVYKGKTSRLPVVVGFPSDWDVTYSINHWCNEETMNSLAHKVLFPYVAKKRLELKFEPDHPALVIFNNFNGGCTEDLLKLLESNHFDVVLVPPNCTD